VILTELEARESVSVLDVGCGDGRLLALLHHALHHDRPDLEPDLHGFDVSDSRVQAGDFMQRAQILLSTEVPEIHWGNRLAMISSSSSWPYPDASFDWVISNHVLEHVSNHDLVFRELARVLRPGGRSVHLFPIRENILEGHVHIPFAHWIRDHDRLRGYLRAGTRMGLGNYRQHHREDPELDIDTFAETRADYLHAFTNYVSKGEILRLAKAVGLRASFRHTEQFYFQKLRALLHLAPARRLRPLRPTLVRGPLVALLSRLSSVTLFLEKQQSYQRPSSAR
jgi:SAM-dependent methyltransferase